MKSACFVVFCAQVMVVVVIIGRRFLWNWTGWGFFTQVGDFRRPKVPLERRTAVVLSYSG